MLSSPEPWRARSVEPIRLPSRAERERALGGAGWNVFRLRSEDVFVDLLTDSGTAAMSAEQWAGLQVGDEAYAGSRSWYRLEDTVRSVTGLAHVLPVHQGRGAETVYTRAFVSEGDVVPGNMHFDTTRAHIRNRGATPIDLVIPEGLDPESTHPFKGNVDLEPAERIMDERHPPLFVLTVTSNTNGGQPVSLANARAVSDLCRRHGVRLLLDAARFAENCYLIREREPGQQGRPVREVARELFSLADAASMSAKKDALVNIGGFLALRSEADLEACAPWAVLYEGYLTYGGMSGRDLEAVARGLLEGTDEAYLEARIRQVRTLHALLDDAAIPVVRPPGGHSVVIDAARFLDHLPREQLPAESLAAALYLEGGVRGVGLGGLAFGERDPDTGEVIAPPWEYLRLAVPRRVYTDNHLAYVAEVLGRLWAKRAEITGLRAVRVPESMAHFTAVMEPLAEAPRRGPEARRIVLLAPPGAGKSTQAARLSAHLGVPRIVMGDLLRDEVASGSHLGARVEPIMAAGDLVPDDLVLDVLAARLTRLDTQGGFVLDGFPRSVLQAEALDRMAVVDLVIALRVPEEELVRRISSRVPRRPDDSPEVVRRRFAVYERDTEPLIHWYRSQGALVEVDGVGDPDEVSLRVVRAVEPV